MGEQPRYRGCPRDMTAAPTKPRAAAARAIARRQGARARQGPRAAPPKTAAEPSPQSYKPAPTSPPGGRLLPNASPLFQRMKRAFGPTGSTTSTCRRGPTRCGRTRRPARLETAAARGCGRVVLRRRLGAPRRRVPRTPREAPATGAGARRRPRGTVGRRRVRVRVHSTLVLSRVRKDRTEPHLTQGESGPSSDPRTPRPRRSIKQKRRLR